MKLQVIYLERFKMEPRSCALTILCTPLPRPEAPYNLLILTVTWAFFPHSSRNLTVLFIKLYHGNASKEPRFAAVLFGVPLQGVVPYSSISSLWTDLSFSQTWNFLPTHKSPSAIKQRIPPPRGSTISPLVSMAIWAIYKEVAKASLVLAVLLADSERTPLEDSDWCSVELEGSSNRGGNGGGPGTTLREGSVSVLIYSSASRHFPEANIHFQRPSLRSKLFQQAGSVAFWRG